VRAILAAFLVFCILLIYTIPIFYEAKLERRLLSASRSIAADMREARLDMLSSKNNYIVVFESGDRSSYKIFVDGRPNLILNNKDISDDLKFIEFTEDGKALVLDNKKIIMNHLKIKDPVIQDYIFLINKRDLDKGIYTRIASVSWDPNTKDIKVFKYDGVDEDKLIILKEI
jgi:hypothetical protein